MENTSKQQMGSVKERDRKEGVNGSIDAKRIGDGWKSWRDDSKSGKMLKPKEK